VDKDIQRLRENVKGGFWVVFHFMKALFWLMRKVEEKKKEKKKNVLDSRIEADLVQCSTLTFR
jgi:hypothetical protein